jgi:small subunit ribosomal protein S1
MTFNSTRDLATEAGNAFIVTPYGVKTVDGSRPCNFDSLHRMSTEQVIIGCGMTPHRADSIYGPSGVLDAVWRGIQKAEVVIVDFTARSANVALEFGWALMLGKRIIVLTQDEKDIPTDVTGLYRYIKYSERFDDVEHMKEELRNQLEAIRQEPADEKMLAPMVLVGGTTPAPGRVIAVGETYVNVQLDDGSLAVLGNGEVEWTRHVKDMTRRFSVDQRVEGAFVTDAKGSSRYTLLAGQTNPWPKLVSDQTSGVRLTGEVRNVVDGVGAFVRLSHGVDGLVPRSQLAAFPSLARGSRVEVTVSKVDVDRRRVDLQLHLALDSTVTPTLVADLPAVGLTAWGETCAVKPSPTGTSGGGFVLVKIPGYDRTGLLHYGAMSEEMRRDFDSNDIKRGDEIYVEVTSVDITRNRITLADRLAPQEDQVPAARPVAA